MPARADRGRRPQRMTDAAADAHSRLRSGPAPAAPTWRQGPRRGHSEAVLHTIINSIGRAAGFADWYAMQAWAAQPHSADEEQQVVRRMMTADDLVPERTTRTTPRDMARLLRLIWSGQAWPGLPQGPPAHEPAADQASASCGISSARSRLRQKRKPCRPHPQTRFLKAGMRAEMQISSPNPHAGSRQESPCGLHTVSTATPPACR